MEFTCIRICENGIEVTQDSELIESSPGIAILRENQIITGFEAASQQYHQPQFTYDRFWKDLNQKPLPNRNKNVRHNADLAYAHIKDVIKRIGKLDTVVVAVPSEYTESERSLLAGIFEASKIPILAVVDSNIASLSSCVPSGDYSILEIYPQHITVSSVTVNSKVTLAKVQVIESTGWQKFVGKITEYVSNMFLEQTRFFPFHDSESERTLNNQITEILRKSKIESSFQVSILHKGIPHTARLDSSEIIQITRELLGYKLTVLAENKTKILVSEKFSSLPGLDALLNKYAIINSSACEIGINLNAKKIFEQTDAVYFIEDFAASSSPIDDLSRDSSTQYGAPTHLLFNDVAHPINSFPTTLRSGTDNQSRKTDGTEAEVFILNGIPTLRANREKISINNKTIISDTALNTGDSIVVSPSGTRFTAIRIVASSAV